MPLDVNQLWTWSVCMYKSNKLNFKLEEDLLLRKKNSVQKAHNKNTRIEFVLICLDPP